MPVPPPRICLLTESFHPRIGGGETHARLLSAELMARGVPVFVLTQRRERAWPQREQVDGVPVHRVGPPGFPRLGKFLMVPAALWQLLRRRRDYDLVYVCGLRTLAPVAVLAARLTGARCVVRAESCGELSGEDVLGRTSGLAQRGVRALLGLRNALILRADRFLGISSAITREFLECGVPPERLVTITNGIDVTRFAPAAPSERAALRSRLGLPGGFLCVYTGKLNRGKGLEMLLCAWTRLAARHPRLHLVLVGSGAGQFLSCEEELKGFVTDHGLALRVSFTGAVGNVEDYLKAADLFVLPSDSEALPIALIEAMACGLPVTATRVGGIPDLVDDGVDGRLIEAGDESGLEAAIEQLLADPKARATLARAARAKAEAGFSIAAIAAAHERLFRSLLAPMPDGQASQPPALP
jgi:glycosyltransferase involved in cell wall biosynthesis